MAEITRNYTVVYKFKDALYINLTNRCPNACVFCAKSKGHLQFHQYNLNLDGKEPSAEQVLTEISKYIKQGFMPKEIIFCGYGEPTMALPVLLETAKKIKQIYHVPLRLNTLGLANLVWGYDVSSDLSLYIDAVNISLNSPDKQKWLKLVRPQKKYEEGAFESMQEFTKNCAKKIKKTTMTIVSNQGVDETAARKMAESLGAKFYVREYFDEE